MYDKYLCEGNLYVTKKSLSILEYLTKAIGNVLEYVDSRLVRKDIPTIFNYDITSYG